jgi:transposase-like protein
MLQSIDTLIGFVVIVLAASLLVTILVQMLSAAFALRGKNLGNALALTFQTIDPDIDKKAYALAERILSDPRLSDSSITMKRLDWSPPANQLRPWSWWSLFNGLQLASAIRPEEIYDLLKKIGGSVKPGESHKSRIGPRKNQLSSDELSKLATKLLEELGRPHGKIKKVNKEFFALRALVDKVSTADEEKKIAEAIHKAQASFEAISADFKGEADVLSKWFTAAQDRAQQWFQMHTRIFTIICGIVLAFLLQLDAAEIFKFVSTNATSRAALAASADKLVDRADGILEKNGSLLDPDLRCREEKDPSDRFAKGCSRRCWEQCCAQESHSRRCDSQSARRLHYEI